jgi:hypothetical protein
MATVKYESTCSLCGQAVEIDGFFLNTQQGLKRFCCAGCQSIYRLLYLQDEIAKTSQTDNTNQEDK